MAAGPGKYDTECTMIREGCNADATLVIVLGGTRGSGFSAQIAGQRPDLLAVIPDMLRSVADEMEHGGV